MFEAGPVRKFLKSLTKRGSCELCSPLEISPQLREVMRTGLTREDAKLFLKTVGTEPYLYVVLDAYGNVTMWDSGVSEADIRGKLETRYPAALWPHRIYVTTVKVEKIYELH